MVKEGQDESEINKRIKEKFIALDQGLSPTNISAIQQLLSLEIEDESWHEIEPKQKRQHIFEALKGLLIGLSEKKPTIIVVDDLQWVDRTSEEFLSYFIDSISQDPILLVLLYRPEYTHPWGNKSHFSQLGLGQLPREPSIELISAIFGDSAVTGELEQLINFHAS